MMTSAEIVNRMQEKEVPVLRNKHTLLSEKEDPLINGREEIGKDHQLLKYRNISTNL